MSGDTYQAIAAAARTLFAQRGYNSVTIKDVAALAGFSPAMVMKVMGSKEALYAAVVPTVTDERLVAETSKDDGESTTGSLGEALVRRIVARRTDGTPEPWVAASLRVVDAGDVPAARAEAQAKMLDWVAGQIGDTTAHRIKAQLVATLLLGLASSVRIMGLFPPEYLPDQDLVKAYGALVQNTIDAPPNSCD